MVKMFESERVAVGFVISMSCGTGKSCDVSGLDVDAASVACIAVVMRRRSVVMFFTTNKKKSYGYKLYRYAFAILRATCKQLIRLLVV